ncbi:MAG: nucleoside-diphosphate kinase [Acidobacteriia bacterium]|nr:nucleoside-diphosphate kinase [Terriglobia bacterium]
MQRTLALIKPDAVKAGHVGAILGAIEKNEFRIVAMKLVHLTKKQAEGFYAVHRGKNFFTPLTDFMSAGPIVAMVLEREEAILKWREVMGATDPAKAAEGSLRRTFGTSIQYNATHGSDAPETAAFETRYFFDELEIC